MADYGPWPILVRSVSDTLKSRTKFLVLIVF